MTVFLGVGSLVLFAAVLVLALGGRPESGRRNDSSRGTGGREGPINLVRGKDFFERSKDT